MRWDLPTRSSLFCRSPAPSASWMTQASRGSCCEASHGRSRASRRCMSGPSGSSTGCWHCMAGWRGVPTFWARSPRRCSRFGCSCPSRRRSARLYFDRIATSVERRFYPWLPPPQGASFLEQAWDGIAVAFKVLALNIVALILAFHVARHWPDPGLDDRCLCDRTWPVRRCRDATDAASDGRVALPRESRRGSDARRDSGAGGVRSDLESV